MIHPHTQLQYINDIVGYGVFATQLIPKGTVIYVQDSLDLEIFPDEYETHSAEMKTHIEKYSYINERGVRIVSWDFAKYVNHCCHSNTMSTAYGFDIALQDIQKGEELTCDYGMLNVEKDMELVCQKIDCRSILKPTDFETCHRAWDEKIRAALPYYLEVEQPLESLILPQNLAALQEYLVRDKRYQSILKLKRNKTIVILPKRHGEFSKN